MSTPRSVTRRSVEYANRMQLIGQIQAAEDRAQRLGLFITARTLNASKNAMGWEIQGHIEMAAKAARGDK